MSTNTAQKQKGPFNQAKDNMEIVANSIYYAMALSEHLMKLNDPELPMIVTFDELLEIDFIIGNLVAADVIMQQAQKISA